MVQWLVILLISCGLDLYLIVIVIIIIILLTVIVLLDLLLDGLDGGGVADALFADLAEILLCLVLALERGFFALAEGEFAA